MKTKFGVRYDKKIDITALMEMLYVFVMLIYLPWKGIWIRVKHGIPRSTKLYLYITGLWFVFGCVSYKLSGYFGKTEYSYLDLVWDLKNSYFTSVLIAMAIKIFNENSEYNSKIAKQYKIYNELIWDSDMLFSFFITEKKSYERIVCLNKKIFYDRNNLNNILEYFKLNEKEIVKKTFDSIEFIKLVKVVLYDLDEIEKNLGKNVFIDVNEEKLYDWIKTIKKQIKKIDSNSISICDAIDWMILLSDYLYLIIDEIRSPGRWDFVTRNKISVILEKYNFGVKNNHNRGIFIYKYDRNRSDVW